MAARPRAAGAIIAGKTNVPPLLMQPHSDNSIFGETNNPWKVERTPGVPSHHAYHFNISGHPTVTLPAGRDEEGMPIGVQLVGPRWGDERLLGIAAAVSDVAGGFVRPAGY